MLVRGDDLKAGLIGGYLALVELGVMMMMVVMISRRSQKGRSQESDVLQHSISIQKVDESLMNKG